MFALFRIARFTALVVVVTACNKPSRGLPAFRAGVVNTHDDTAWFLPATPSEDAPDIPVVAYALRSGSWTPLHISWRDADRHLYSDARSGPVRSSTTQLPHPFAFWQTIDRVDPRYARSADSSLHSLPHLMLNVGRDTVSVDVTLPDTMRNRMYMEGGGSITRGHNAPPFSTMPARWARNGDTIAFAFPAASPPTPESDFTPLSEDDQAYDPLLSSITVLDPARKKWMTVAHPRLIEHNWTGLEIVDGSLWMLPGMVTQPDVEYADAPSRNVPPRLARYDLSTHAWQFFDSSAVPLRGELLSMSSRGSSLMIVSSDGLAALDTKSMHWDVRFYADSSYQLEDGADTTVTMLVATRRAPDTSRVTDDSAAVYAAFAAELPVRHRSEFLRELKRSAAYEDVASVVEGMQSQRGGRWDDGRTFVMEDSAATEILRQPPFQRYMREALWNPATQDFAFGALRPAGRDVLIDAARTTLAAGTLRAAISAADSLTAWGDSSGARWIDHTIADVSRITARGPVVMQTLSQLVYRFRTATVAQTGDAKVEQLLAALETIDTTLAPASGRRGYLAGVFSSTPEGSRRVARAIERRPALASWWFEQTVARDSSILADPEIRHSASRIAATVLDAPDTLILKWYSEYESGDRFRLRPEEIRAQAEWNRMRPVLPVIPSLDPALLVPSLVHSLKGDTTLTWWKAYSLLLLTGNEGAPLLLYATDPAQYRELRDYWTEWWKTHEKGFVAPDLAQREAARKRWTARLPK